MSEPRRQTILLGLFIACLFAAISSTAEAQEIENVEAGFQGQYKLGCWTPVEVTVRGGAKPQMGIVTITVPDGDGVPTTVSTPPDRPLSLEADKRSTVRLFVRVGQNYSSLEVRFEPNDGESIRRVFYPSPNQGEGFTSGLPATSRLFLELGPSVGLAELVGNETDDELTQNRVARLQTAAELPTEWYGYEGVDVLVLTTSRPEIYRNLMQNSSRVAALKHWIEMGGKLVIFCGSQSEELLAAGSPLAELIPGTFTETVVLEQSQPIEAFSGAEQSITPNRRVELRVPLLSDIRGKVLASADLGGNTVPLVIQSYLGFGEITFVGLDFDRDPLAEWVGRKSFLERALNLKNDTGSQTQNPGVATVSNDDLVTSVRNLLDESFVGVTVVPFALVAVLVIGYILLIGPGDYFLVNKVFKRPEVTWISFPLVVIAVSAGAYWFANWQKGDQLRVNQVEFVDVDATTGLTRGTVWTHFFTPRVDRFNLSLTPAVFENSKLDDSNKLVAWLGQPGYGLGGMQNSGGQASLFDRGYAFDTALDKMIGLPVQLWSTKTITARWSAEIVAPVEATLNRTVEQLVVGQVSNNSKVTLENAVLLYGSWAWPLGDIAPESAANIADAKQPRTVRTLLTNATAGDTTITETADDGTVPFRLVQNDMTRLAKLVMFFDSINGERYAGLISRYQSFLDMSHLLDQPDLAILLCKAKTTGSQWYDGEKPLADDKQDDKNLDWTYYRFVVPVGPLTE